jgi:hypothetical protein
MAVTFAMSFLVGISLMRAAVAARRLTRRAVRSARDRNRSKTARLSPDLKRPAPHPHGSPDLAKGLSIATLPPTHPEGENFSGKA